MLSRLVQVSALVTAFAALIYGLGIVALWMPIARAFTNDFSTALYAVSLMSRTMVAGQGVRSLFGAALFVTLLFFLLNLLIAAEVELYIRAFGRKPTERLSNFLIYLPLLVLGGLVGWVTSAYGLPLVGARIGVLGSENVVLALVIAHWALFFLGFAVLRACADRLAIFRV